MIPLKPRRQRHESISLLTIVVVVFSSDKRHPKIGRSVRGSKNVVSRVELQHSAQGSVVRVVVGVQPGHQVARVEVPGAELRVGGSGEDVAGAGRVYYERQMVRIRQMAARTRRENRDTGGVAVGRPVGAVKIG